MSLNIREAEIENDQVWFLAEELKRSLASGRLENLIALGRKAHFQKLADGRLVIDDQNLRWRGGHAAVSNFCISAGMGSLIVNTARVRSVRFPAMIVPCIASTKPREIANPSPVPARTWSAFLAR